MAGPALRRAGRISLGLREGAAAEYEYLERLRDGAHHVLLIYDGVTLPDQSHQVLSLVVPVGLLLNAAKMLLRRGEDRDGGFVAYEHYTTLPNTYPAAHFLAPFVESICTAITYRLPRHGADAGSRHQPNMMGPGYHLTKQYRLAVASQTEVQQEEHMAEAFVADAVPLDQSLAPARSSTSGIRRRRSSSASSSNCSRRGAHSRRLTSAKPALRNSVT